MRSSSGKCKEGEFSLKMHSINWTKSKRFYSRKKISDSCKDDPVFYTETEKKKRDETFSSKMTLSPNVEEFPAKDSEHLKYDRSLLTQVLNLILMMIGCILLKLDHKPQVKQKYKDIFSDRSLEILRSDLSNLLCFETKSSVTWMLMDLMNSQAAGELIWSEDLKNCTNPKKLILRRTLISVVNFMIFRRSKQKIGAKSKVRRSISTLKPGTNLENGSKLKTKFSFLGDWIGNFKNVRSCTRICWHLFSTINSICNDYTNFGKEENIKETSLDMDLSQGQLNRYGDDFYDCASSRGIHSCKKIYCPLCFGWLWIPLYYCFFIFVVPLVTSLIIRFTNGIRFLL